MKTAAPEQSYRAAASEPLYRSFTLDRKGLNPEKRTVNLSFSSELPVERWGTLEVLDHSSASVNLERLKDSGPFLLDHDRTKQIGVVESADIQNKRGVATVRFGKSALAEEIFTDVKDGIRKLVSVGYRVNKMVLEKSEAGVETYRATSWMPFEISIVSIPADPTVGIGRADRVNATENNKVKSNILLNYDPASGGGGRENQDPAQYARSAWDRSEDSRVQEIMAISTRMAKFIPGIHELAQKAVREGTEINEFRKIAFLATPGTVPISNPDPMVGMGRRDLEQYSIRRAIACAASGKFDGLEGEMDQETRKQYQANGWACRAQGPHSIIVPFDVLNYRHGDPAGLHRRDALVGTASLGGNVVATNLLAGSFIELLRVKMKVAALGATYLAGLVGNVAIPSQTGGATAYWAASEAAATTESSITFGQVTMAPKTVTARLDYSALLLQQSTPTIDMLIRMDLVNQIARAIDLAALHGSGASGQPTGIASMSGIGSVTGGTNGAAATYGNIIALETAIANANADGGAMGYLTNSRQRALLKQKLMNSTGTDASFIWSPRDTLDGSGVMNGYRAEVSNNVSNTLTKGTSTTVCSAIFFADWSSLLIGQWGGLELLTNPFTQAANRIVEVYAYQFVDVNARHVENFAAMLDAL